MKVISLGWGTQSFTLAAMVALGELPMVDAVIHSDTTHEASWTYKTAKKYTKWLEDRGVNVVTVKPAKNKLDGFNELKGIYIPAYTTDGISNGQLKRQCTADWKISPIRRWLQANRNGEQIEMWLGITLDEVQRMRESPVKYIEHIYPLIDAKMSRHDCLNWLQNHGLDIPKRSACVFCPFHSKSEWREIRNSKPDWEQALSLDGKVRRLRPTCDVYICNQRMPLEECDFDSQEDKGQIAFQWQDECTGYCGN